MAVVVFHYHHFYLATATDRGGIPPEADMPYGTVLGWLLAHGHMAVELFWVISGFVFAHVYMDRPTGVREFAAARIARLYPLHLVTLVFVAALQTVSMAQTGHFQIYANNDWRYFLVHLALASHWLAWLPGLSFNAPIWSVSLEIVAYAIFFVSLPLLRRFGLGVAVAVGAAAWALGLYAQPLDLPGIRLQAFVCTGYFFVGVVACLVLRQAPEPGAALRRMAGAGVCVAAFGVYAGAEDMVLAAASLSAVALAALQDIRSGRTCPGWLRWLGDLSYSLYLVHVPLQMTVLLIADLAFGATRAFAGSPWTLPVYLAASLGLAHLSYMYLEKPAGRWLRARLSRPRAAPA